MTDNLQYIAWFFTGLSLIGAYINSRGNLLLSSIIWMGANCFWLLLDASRDLWDQCALYLAFIAMNVLGINTCFKKKRDGEKTQG